MIKWIFKIIALVPTVLIIAAVGFYLYVASLNGKRAVPLAELNSQVKRPLFFAHRGGLGEAPENTIAAFEKAAATGVDVLELDVHTTADGEFVVHHDRSVERTTDGSGLIAEKSLADLKKLDAGYRFSADGGKTFPFRGNGVGIPTLSEVFQKFPDKLINVEVKRSDKAAAERLCSLIDENGRKQTVIVASAGGAMLEEFRRKCEGVPTSATFREAIWFLFLYKLGMSENFSADMQALQVPERLFGSDLITDDFIRAAKERNLEIHIWTANKRSDIERLIDAGVDGVMTDFPGRLQDLPENVRGRR